MPIPIITPPVVPVNETGDGGFLFDDGDGNRSWEMVEVTAGTATDLTGYLKGDGANVSAVAPAAMLSTILADTDVTTLGASGAVAVDASAHAVYDLTPAGNITLTITNDSRGSAVTIRVNASAFTITWSVTGLKWVGGAAPTLPTAAGRSMLISLKRFGTNDWIGIASDEAY